MYTLLYRDVYTRLQFADCSLSSSYFYYQSMHVPPFPLHPKPPRTHTHTHMWPTHTWHTVLASKMRSREKEGHGGACIATHPAASSGARAVLLCVCISIFVASNTCALFLLLCVLLNDLPRARKLWRERLCALGEDGTYRRGVVLLRRLSHNLSRLPDGLSLG